MSELIRRNWIWNEIDFADGMELDVLSKHVVGTTLRRNCSGGGGSVFHGKSDKDVLIFGDDVTLQKVLFLLVRT